MIQLLCRFTDAGAGFLDRSRPALTLLAAQPTCRRLMMSRSTEHPARWVLSAEFDSFAGYRAALSPFDVRTLVIPFLSSADQELSAVLEVAALAEDHQITDLELLVDPDAVG